MFAGFGMPRLTMETTAPQEFSRNLLSGNFLLQSWHLACSASQWLKMNDIIGLSVCHKWGIKSCVSFTTSLCFVSGGLTHLGLGRCPLRSRTLLFGLPSAYPPLASRSSVSRSQSFGFKRGFLCTSFPRLDSRGDVPGVSSRVITSSE